MLLTSFDAVADHDAEILILGSMPGKASLLRHQYYAHQRNAFWPIMAKLYAIPLDLAYSERLVCLQQRKVALWDVMRNCERVSSLDADIVESTIVVNDFVRFLQHHSCIRLIVLNGQKAFQTFKRYALPLLSETGKGIECVVLPSTSPAHASLSFSQKYEQWQQALT